MNHRLVLYALTPLLLAVFVVHFAYASDSTQIKYCKNGICSTANHALKGNATLGLYPPGMYNGPNGIALVNAKRIGVELSKTCLIMQQYNITSGCLTYDKLWFLDNTNSDFSGKWVFDGQYHRLPPPVKDAYKFYNGTVIVMVDPDPTFMVKAIMVTVTDKNFTWINPDDSSKGGLVTVTHINRSVLNCDQATVAPIVSLVEDTVKYLESGCIKTAFNDTQITYHKDIPFSYDNPFSSLHYNIAKLKADKNQTPNCITKKCETVPNPYKKAAWGK